MAAGSTEGYEQAKELRKAARSQTGQAARKLHATCSDVCLALHGNCDTRSNSASRHGPAEAVSGASNCLGREELSAHPCQCGTAGRRARRRFCCTHRVSSKDGYSVADKPRYRELTRSEKNYPRIRASVEQQVAAQGGVSVARTAYLPRTDILWQTNRATANNVYGLLLPQGVVPSISGPVLAADNGRSAWSSAGGALVSWQPFDFGLRRAQVNSAQQGATAATAGLNLTRLDLEVATTNA